MSASNPGSVLATELAAWVEERSDTSTSTRPIDRTELAQRIREVLEEPGLTSNETLVVGGAAGRIDGEQVRTLVEHRIARALAVGLGLAATAGAAPALPAVVAAPSDVGPGTLAVTERVADLGATLTLDPTDAATFVLPEADGVTSPVEGLLIVGEEDEVRTLAGDAALEQVRRAMPVELLPSGGVDRILAEMRARLESAGVALDPAPASDDDMIGRVLGDQYLIVERLGKGGFGTVYKATDQLLGHQVAVKMLRREHRTNENLVREFVDEAKRLFSLEHENIGGWKTFNKTEEGEVYFVLELLQGEELEDVLRREEVLDPERAGRILLQVLRALDRAHHLSETESLLHLDLKPQNVFVSSDDATGADRVKVIDFGIGQIVRHDADEDELRIAGLSVDYASPEQCAYLLPGMPRVRLDGRADLFSLGVLAFRMLTGELPHGGDLPNDVADDYRDSDGRLHPRLVRPLVRTHVSCRTVASTGAKVPKPLAHFVDRCLALDRDDRYPDSRAALEDLERIVDPSPLQRFGVAVLTVLVAVVLGAVGLTKALSDPAEREVALIGDDSVRLASSGLVLGSARRTATVRPEDASVLDGSNVPKLVALDAGTVPADWLARFELKVVESAGLRGIAVSAADDGPAGRYECRLDFGGGVRSSAFLLHVLDEKDWDIGTPRFEEDFGTTTPSSDPWGAKLLVPLEIDATAVDPSIFVPHAWIDDGTSRHDLDPEYDRAERGFVAEVPKLVLNGGCSLTVQVVHPATGALEKSSTYRFDTRALEITDIAVRLASDDGLGETVDQIPKGRASFLVVESNRPARLSALTIIDSGERQLDVAEFERDDEGRFAIPLEEIVRGDDDHRVTFVVRLEDDRRRMGPRVEPENGLADDQRAFIAVRKDLRFELTSDGQGTRIAPFRVRTSTFELGLEKYSSQSATFDGTLQFFGTGGEIEALEELRSVSLDPQVMPALASARAIEMDLAGAELEAEDGWYRVAYNGRSEVNNGVGAPAVLVESSDGVVEHFVVLDRTAPTFAFEPADRPVAIVGEEGSAEIGNVLARIVIDERPKLGTVTSPVTVALDVLRAESRTRLAPTLSEELTDGASLESFLDGVRAALEGEGDGRYLLELRASDGAGNASAIERIEIDVAASGPRVAIQFREAGTRPEWIEVEGMWRLPLDVEDPNGITSVEYAIEKRGSDAEPKWVDVPLQEDGVTEQRPTRFTGTVNVSIRKDYGLELSGHVVTVSVRATDAHGNRSDVRSKERTMQGYGELRRRELAPIDSSSSRMRLVEGNDERYAFSGSSSIAEERAKFDQVSDVDVDSFPDANREGRWNRLVYDAGAIRDFYMDEHEVTNGQFLEFVDASDGYRSASNWIAGGAPDSTRRSQLEARLGEADGDMPVRSVTWYEASAYARWVGKRLPTLVEFEYAVRDGASYRSWSAAGGPAKLSSTVVNFGGVRPGPWRVGAGADVTVEGAVTSAGIRDLAGNLREWTSSPAWIDDRSVWGLGRTEQVASIVHGGSADGLSVGDLRFCAGSDFSWSRADFCTLDALDADEAEPSVGFRCVIDRETAKRHVGTRFEFEGETLYD